MTPAALATLVATQIKAPLVPTGTVVTRTYSPDEDLLNDGKLHVYVVPGGVTITPATRGNTRESIAIRVIMAKKMTTADNTEGDALLAYVDAVYRHLRTTSLGGFREPNVRLSDSALAVAWRERRQYLAEWQLSYFSYA